MTSIADSIEMLPSKEAARIIGIDPATLCRWRTKRRGPAYLDREGRIYYTRADIAAWQERIRVDPSA